MNDNISSNPEGYRGFSTECTHAIANALRDYLQGHEGWHHFSFEVKLDERGGVDMRGIRYGLAEQDGWTWRLQGAYTPRPADETKPTRCHCGLYEWDMRHHQVWCMDGSAHYHTQRCSSEKAGGGT